MAGLFRNSFVGAGVVAALAATTACRANESPAPEGLAAFEGIWEVPARGPGPGGRTGSGEAPPPRDERPAFGRGPRSADPVTVAGLDIEGLDHGDAATYRMMTPAGKAAFRAMDPRDLPANNCKSNGLPSLVGIPDLQQWSVDGDVLTIHYANFNTVRTIYLDGRPAGGGPSLYGHSTGSFEDGVLTVTTTGYTATPGGLGRNSPGSASRVTVERYRFVGDGMRGDLTIHDPEYLTRDIVRPIVLEQAHDVTGIEEVPCDVEASQRYLD